MDVDEVCVTLHALRCMHDVLILMCFQAARINAMKEEEEKLMAELAK